MSTTKPRAPVSLAAPRPRTDERFRTVDEVVREHVLSVLKGCGGSKKAAARALGVSFRTLYNWLSAWGVK